MRSVASNGPHFVLFGARMHKEQADENRRRQRRRNVDFRFTVLFYVALWSRDFTERKKRTAARIPDGRF